MRVRDKNYEAVERVFLNEMRRAGAESDDDGDAQVVVLGIVRECEVEGVSDGYGDDKNSERG